MGRPFLTWDTGPVTTESGTYLGDPVVEHAVTGSPLNYNKFGVDRPDGTKVENDQFSLLGKVARNTGVKADAAIRSAGANGQVVEVFASSEADPGELYVAADTAAGIKTTPMVASAETGLQDVLRPRGDDREPGEHHGQEHR